MSIVTPALEARLGAYGAALDAAVAVHRCATVAVEARPTSDGLDALVEIGATPTRGPRRRAATIAAVAAAGVLLVGAGALVSARRQGGTGITPGGGGTQTTAEGAIAPGDGAVPTSYPGDGGGTGPTPGAHPGDGGGAGATPTLYPGDDVARCTETNVPSADFSLPTLYLGGEPNEVNPAPGFVYSLPAGTPAEQVATDLVAQGVLGTRCGISATTTAAGNVSVVVSPPVVGHQVVFDVEVAERDGVVGVTRISSAVELGIDTSGDAPVLELRGDVAAAAVTASARFRKGASMWQVSIEPAAGATGVLAVPEVEVDPEPAAAVEWVMVTLHDDQQRLVGLAAVPL